MDFWPPGPETVPVHSALLWWPELTSSLCVSSPQLCCLCPLPGLAFLYPYPDSNALLQGTSRLCSHVHTPTQSCTQLHTLWKAVGAANANLASHPGQPCLCGPVPMKNSHQVDSIPCTQDSRPVLLYTTGSQGQQEISLFLVCFRCKAEGSG